MADEAEEQMTKEQKQEEADVLASFAGKVLPEETAPVVATAEEEPKPEGEEKPAEKPAEPQPDYVQITREEVETFRRYAALVPTLQRELQATRTVADRAHGISGDVQKQVRDFASSAGREIPVTKEDFADLAKEYPDVAEMLVGGLQRTLKKMPAGGMAKAEVDPETVNGLVRKEIQKVELEDLHRVYPDWRQVTQAFEGGDPNCEYRVWLRTKPADYQELMAKTGSGGDVRRSIDWWHAEKRVAQATPQIAITPAKPAQRQMPRTAVRQPDRFRAAVTPNGAARPATVEPSELDEVMAAFNSGKS